MVKGKDFFGRIISIGDIVKSTDHEYFSELMGHRLQVKKIHDGNNLEVFDLDSKSDVGDQMAGEHTKIHMRKTQYKNKVASNPAVKHNWSDKEKQKTYRNRGKRVAGGYLDMNGELVKFG